MERILEFKERKGDFSYLIKVSADNGFFSKYLDLLEIAFLNSVVNQPVNRKEDFFVYLKCLYKNSQPRCFIKRNRVPTVSVDRTYRTFSFSSPYGSFIKGNFAKGYAEGKVLEGDTFNYFLLWSLITYCFLYNFSTRVHAAWVTTENNSFLLAGHGGAGKSTLSGLLKRIKEYKVLDDDDCFTISTQQNPYLFSLAPEYLDKDAFLKYLLCSSIFFIQLNKAQKSKIYAISKKEAFSRIVFLSEFPKYENDKQRERRIENLNRLVDCCESFLLINGKDLKNNPKRLEYLLSPHLINH